MQFIEDDLQDAWVALLEKGGPSAVADTRSWLIRTAHNIALRRNQVELREIAAQCEAAEAYTHPLYLAHIEFTDRRRQDDHERYMREREDRIAKNRERRKDPAVKAREREYNKKRSGHTWASFKSKSPEEQERIREQGRERNRRYKARKRAERQQQCES